MLTSLYGFQRRFQSVVRIHKFQVVLVLIVATSCIQSTTSAPSPAEDSLAKQEFIDSELAKLLNKYVLIQTENGYILGRSQRSDMPARERRLPGVERNFQLRVRKAKPFKPESNFQLRVRKAPIERNFQLRVRKSMSVPQRVTRYGPSAESNFQLRVRKSHPDANFQLRVRKAPRLERNFQLRVRKSDPSMVSGSAGFEAGSPLQRYLDRYQLLRGPEGQYLLQEQAKRNAEELEDELEEEF